MSNSLLGDGPHLRVELVKGDVLYKTSELNVRVEEKKVDIDCFIYFAFCAMGEGGKWWGVGSRGIRGDNGGWVHLSNKPVTRCFISLVAIRIPPQQYFAIGKQVLGVQSHQLQLRCVEILNQHDEMFIKNKDSELA